MSSAVCMITLLAGRAPLPAYYNTVAALILRNRVVLVVVCLFDIAEDSIRGFVDNRSPRIRAMVSRLLRHVQLHIKACYANGSMPPPSFFAWNLWPQPSPYPNTMDSDIMQSPPIFISVGKLARRVHTRLGNDPHDVPRPNSRSTYVGIPT